MLGRTRTLFVIGLSAIAIASACSGSEETGNKIDPNAAAGSTSTGGSGSGAAGSGAFSGIGGSAAGPGVGGTGGGGIGPANCDGVLGDACATEQHIAEAEPVDIYIMLDQSTSMNDPAGAGTIWNAVTSALKSFVNLPESAGIRVGIQYFGQPGTDDQGHSCNPADYTNPDVAIAELPANAAALVASINGHQPSTLTPTRPALEGALNYARTWAAQNPDRTTVVVLATDGFPTVCNTDLNAMRDLAAQAAAATPRILTFIVGLGGDQNLRNLAIAGGTGEPFIIDTGAGVNTEQQFAQAMRTIASTPLACDYAIPRNQDGGGADPGTLNLTYTPVLSACTVIRKVLTQAECGSVERGWFFDNNNIPGRILLCPGTCSGLGAGSIDIRVGCPTLGPR